MVSGATKSRPAVRRPRKVREGQHLSTYVSPSLLARILAVDEASGVLNRAATVRTLILRALPAAEAQYGIQLP